MNYLEWHVGMKVVCVEALRRRPLSFEEYPDVGRVYTIRHIEADEDGVFIRLMEVRNPAARYNDGTEEVVFDAGYFRPVEPRKSDISIFTAMLTGAKERERA